jgi:hypothetical protein
MIKTETFRTDDGIDWKAYEAAQVAAGERCKSCGKYFSPLPWPTPGPRECYGCIELTKIPEVSHHSKVRCPACRHTWDVGESEDLYSEGEHSVYCHECNHEFEVTTNVSYEFVSPELETPE